MYDNNIRYSICGHQIVNLYDAAGRKYKSVIYTNTATAGTQYDEIAHYEFDMDTIAWRITEYNNNVELVYTREDTITRRIHNSIGYNADGIYYHYIKDHLGNICAVVNSSAITTFPTFSQAINLHISRKSATFATDFQNICTYEKVSLHLCRCTRFDSLQPKPTERCYGRRRLGSAFCGVRSHRLCRPDRHYPLLGGKHHAYI